MRGAHAKVKVRERNFVLVLMSYKKETHTFKRGPEQRGALRSQLRPHGWVGTEPEGPRNPTLALAAVVRSKACPESQGPGTEEP